MVPQSNGLVHPIGVMYVLHNALRTAAAGLEELIRRFEIGDSLQAIRRDFTAWAVTLMYHADQEDRYMTRRLAGWASARDCEKEHAELNEKLEDVVSVLNDEIGKTRVIARTQRHLYGAVVALQIAQDDHLESEEALVLPAVRERFDEFEQLQMVKHLLIDEEAENPRWVLEWMGQNLDSDEQRILIDLESRFNTVVTRDRLG